MVDTVHVRRRDPIDRIAPEIYGHFAEHLGRCIYGGLWVGDDDRVDTIDGLREDTVSLLRDLDMPVLRWPGGCFADDYHWKDGIGPREERPRTRNMWWTQGRENVPEEPNDFGTDEFVRLCDLVDAEPYIAVNVGSGSPQEAIDWVEYCNYGGDTEWADRRADNGTEEPHGVTYWGIGNENWGCGGRYSPEQYAEEFRRFANYVAGADRLLSEAPLELIGCGHTSDDWNRAFLEQLGEGVPWREGAAYHLLDHLSVHRYYHAGDATDFSDDGYYRLFAKAGEVARDVDRAVAALDTFAPGSDVGVIVDEWGVWHPSAVYDNGLEQPNTVRDALSAAGVFDDLNARADVVTMANIAQTVNVLQCLVQTDESAAWPTPTYRVFDLYRPHMGATALETTVETDERSVEGEDRDVPLVSASASERGDTVFATVTNRDRDDPRQIALSVDAAEPTVEEAAVLFGERDPEDRSTGANAEGFAPDDLDLADDGSGSVDVGVPASSIVAVTLGV